jgi:uncharacterized membrane protein
VTITSKQPRPADVYRIRIGREAPLLLLIAALAVGALLAYPRLPNNLLMNWGFWGTVDQYAPKTLLNVLLMPLYTAVVYLVMLFGPLRDPNRNKYGSDWRVYVVIRYVVTLFMCFISAFGLCGGGHDHQGRIAVASLSLFVVAAGSVLGNMRPNFVVGIRLPWTLNSQEVWTRTHQLTEKLFALSGAIGFAGALISRTVGMALLMGPLALSIGALVLYSRAVHRSLKDRSGQ